MKYYKVENAHFNYIQFRELPGSVGMAGEGHLR